MTSTACAVPNPRSPPLNPVRGAIVGRHRATRSRMKRLVYRFYLASDDTEPCGTTVGASFAYRGDRHLPEYSIRSADSSWKKVSPVEHGPVSTAEPKSLEIRADCNRVQSWSAST